MKVHNKANLLTVTTQHISLRCRAERGGGEAAFCTRLRLPPGRCGPASWEVNGWIGEGWRWRRWWWGGFMEMRKCNGTHLSVPVAGTVALCVFYQGHERGTMSLSAINNMVSFEADYPSVEEEENKGPGDNGWSYEPRFLLPWEDPSFCCVLFLQSNLPVLPLIIIWGNNVSQISFRYKTVFFCCFFFLHFNVPIEEHIKAFCCSGNQRYQTNV